MNILIYAVLVSFLISLLQGPLFIPILRRLKFGQNIREEGPKSHQKKAGTPTMGGIIFIITAALTLVIMSNQIKGSTSAIFCFVCFFGFGIIGFLDDYLKILRKKNEGLTAKQKAGLQLIFSFVIAIYAAINIGTDLYIPVIGRSLQLGTVPYVISIVFFLLAVSNGVNLTDGLDGLATSVTLLVLTFFAMVSFSWHNFQLAIFCAIIAGALLGFLRYNSFPAQIFMGDTGSLALGGAVAAIAIVLKLPLIILIVGGIYAAEVLSVVIQVTYYKMTKKRFFKMAPLHHHFEQLGWHESKVVAVFSIVTVILCLFAFLSL